LGPCFFSLRGSGLQTSLDLAYASFLMDRNSQPEHKTPKAGLMDKIAASVRSPHQ